MQNRNKREYVIAGSLIGAGVGLWLLAMLLQAFDISFRVVWIVPFAIRVFGVVIFLAGVLRAFHALRGNAAAKPSE